MAKIDSTIKKLGRRPNGDDSAALVKITFKVDDETLRALTELETSVGADVRGRRSVFLRRLILDTWRNRNNGTP